MVNSSTVHASAESNSIITSRRSPAGVPGRSGSSPPTRTRAIQSLVGTGSGCPLWLGKFQLVQWPQYATPASAALPPRTKLFAGTRKIIRSRVLSRTLPRLVIQNRNGSYLEFTTSQTPRTARTEGRERPRAVGRSGIEKELNQKARNDARTEAVRQGVKRKSGCSARCGLFQQL